MTTAVKVAYCNFPVLIQTWDRRWNDEARRLDDDFVLTSEQVLRSGEITLYATTTRKIVAIDIEEGDPRAKLTDLA